MVQLLAILLFYCNLGWLSVLTNFLLEISFGHQTSRPVVPNLVVFPLTSFSYSSSSHSNSRPQNQRSDLHDRDWSEKDSISRNQRMRDQPRDISEGRHNSGLRRANSRRTRGRGRGRGPSGTRNSGLHKPLGGLDLNRNRSRSQDRARDLPRFQLPCP